MPECKNPNRPDTGWWQNPTPESLPRELVESAEDEFGEVFKCPECPDRTFATRRGAAFHIKKVHGGNFAPQSTEASPED